jgi:rubrerythrin
MIFLRDSLPDFWDENNTSERIGEWLAVLGYRKQRKESAGMTARVSEHSEVTKDRLEPGVDKLGVPFWSCPGCGKQWIKTQRNYCPKCRFGMGAE